MQLIRKKNSTRTEVKQASQKLEVDDKKRKDLFNIVGNKYTDKNLKKEKRYHINKISRLVETEFVDDAGVQFLM